MHIKENIYLKFYLIFLIFLISSCSKVEINKENLLLGKIKNEVIAEIQNKFGYLLAGSGVGEHNGLKMVGLSFSVYHPVSRNECRLFFVTAIESLLKKINFESELIPHLRDYPFSEDNIQIFLYCYQNENLEPVPYSSICGGYANENGITYLKFNPKNNKYDFISEDETYEEAKAILEQQGYKF